MNASLRTMLCRLNTVACNRQACAWFAVMMVIAALVYSPAEAAPIAVRFSEGVTHGFLLVRSLAGEIIGQGEMTQVVKEGDLVESHLVFKFKDGSLYDEKVVFSQQRVFTLISYRLSQHGPSFPDQIDVSIDRASGEYTVRSTTGEEGKEEVLTGLFDLPKDVYNGMIIYLRISNAIFWRHPEGGCLYATSRFSKVAGSASAACHHIPQPEVVPS